MSRRYMNLSLCLQTSSNKAGKLGDGPAIGRCGQDNIELNSIACRIRPVTRTSDDVSGDRNDDSPSWNQRRSR